MPRKPNPELQEKLAAVKREQILLAARAVFAERGFHRATIKDVATRAGVADGTVYNYFENKTALILGLLDWLNQSDQREMDFGKVEHTDLEGFVRTYVHERFGFLMDEGLTLFQAILPEILSNEELRRLYRDSVIEPTLQTAQRALGPAMQAGGLGRVEAALTLRLISAMFVGLIVLRVVGDDQLEKHWNKVPDVAAEMILRAFQKHEKP